MPTPYASFIDPVGLVRRMVASRDPSAWWSLVLAALRPLVAPLDRVWEAAERDVLGAVAGEPSQPLVLVVGGSRSGTTLAYELLVATTDVSYISNLTALFPRSPITATRRLGALARPPALTSYYGQTAGFGGTNDGFGIWDRWLGSDRYRPDRPDEATAAAMRRFFAAWTAMFPRPLVNKNNRNTLVIDGLAAALPSARFVAVRRDRRAVVRSLVRARAQIQGDVRTAWGLAAQDAGPDDLGHVDAVHRQVVEIDATLDAQLSRVAAERVTDVAYEDVCADPRGIVRAVAAMAGLRVDADALARLPAMNPSPGPVLSSREEQRLTHLIGSAVEQ
ncbi:MAG: sulfotransferase [Actinobacteria bacterium]|nr:sulfotransferase [Actinomycetota bacterium]